MIGHVDNFLLFILIQNVFLPEGTNVGLKLFTAVFNDFSVKLITELIFGIVSHEILLEISRTM